MKLYVNGLAEFEVSIESTVNELKLFLIHQGFENIGIWHFDKEYIICTADYYGRDIKSFKTPLVIEWYDISAFNVQEADFNKRYKANAEMLNKLCHNNGR